MKDCFVFEWDPRKGRSNEHKHGISFEEARAVFYDENARFMADPEHSQDEERFVMLGLSSKPRILVVCHCYRATGSIIRIISARRATKKETLQYEEYLK
ncbi:MAG: BrnT family toxin [Elusimicrobiota bacterium]